MSDADLKSEVLAILGENRIMSVATVRPDGWPQATMVGYVNDGLSLYFAVARNSQKLANIQRDARVSIAIGHDEPDRIRGVSFAARATEVVDLAEIARLNELIQRRYPEQAVFAPREALTAIVKATPTIVSVVDLTKGPGTPVLAVVETQVTLRPIPQDEAPVMAGPPPARLG